MLASFWVLMSWRLTGLVLHEWLGLALLALVVGHLLIHWGWVETRVGALVQRRRRFGALLLNAALFVAMGVALISGLVISKVIFPNALTPTAYLWWHGLHEDGSNFSMWLMAFHVAYNWDRIKGSLQHALERVRRIPVRPLRWSDVEVGLAAKRLLWVAGISAALTAVVFADARRAPRDTKVMIVRRDGRRELSAPPREIVTRSPQYDWPQLGQGATRRFVLSGGVMVFFGLVGRAAMRRRRRAKRPPAGEPATA